MKLQHTLALAVLGLLLAGAVAGYVATDAGDTTTTAGKAETPAPAALIDRRPLQIAQRLSSLAGTADEQELAREAVRVGDHSVDLALTIALLEAAEHPVDSTPEIRQIRERVQAAARLVTEDSTRLAQLTSAQGGRSEPFQTHVELAKAQLELHRGDLADAQTDFAQHVEQVQAASAEDLLAKTRHLSSDQKVLAGMTRRVEDQVSLLDLYPAGAAWSPHSDGQSSTRFSSTSPGCCSFCCSWCC